MKIFTHLIFISLISLFISTQDDSYYCNPGIYKGDVSLRTCAEIGRSFTYNECCMITYTDTESNVYHVCYVLSARSIIHFDHNIELIKQNIQSYYPKDPLVSTIDYFECSSKYVQLSFLALLLILL